MDRVRVAVMGRAGVGKSAITLRYVRNKFVPDYDPTVENSYRKFTADGDILEILDTAGQERSYSGRMERSWMRDRDAFIFVFSLVDRQTFDELDHLLDSLLDQFDDDPPPSVLLANKADMPKSRWCVTEQELEALSSRWRNMRAVYLSSALKNSNIRDAFEFLASQVKEQMRLQAPEEPEDPFLNPVDDDDEILDEVGDGKRCCEECTVL